MSQHGQPQGKSVSKKGIKKSKDSKNSSTIEFDDPRKVLVQPKSEKPSSGEEKKSEPPAKDNEPSESAAKVEQGPSTQAGITKENESRKIRPAL